jgi:hypothetical protein
MISIVWRLYVQTLPCVYETSFIMSWWKILIKRSMWALPGETSIVSNCITQNITISNLMIKGWNRISYDHIQNWRAASFPPDEEVVRYWLLLLNWISHISKYFKYIISTCFMLHNVYVGFLPTFLLISSLPIHVPIKTHDSMLQCSSLLSQYVEPYSFSRYWHKNMDER